MYMSFDLILDLEIIDASFECMRFTIRLKKRELEPCHSLMQRLGANSFSSFRMSQNSPHGRFGNSLMMSPLFS